MWYQQLKRLHGRTAAETTEHHASCRFGRGIASKDNRLNRLLYQTDNIVVTVEEDDLQWFAQELKEAVIVKADPRHVEFKTETLGLRRAESKTHA